MIRWLWKIIVGKPACARECQWQAAERINVYGQDDDRRPIATKFVLRCATCGDIKSKEV
jgi:hypothetical protein